MQLLPHIDQVVIGYVRIWGLKYEAIANSNF